jgi:hypothetical protein
LRRLRYNLRSSVATVLPYAVPIVYLEFAVWIGFLMISTISGFSTDSTADWLVASAARDGLDPYADLRDLARTYDVPYATPAWQELGSKPWVHPRTPGALLILQPVTLLNPDVLHSVLVVVSLMLFGYMGGRLFPKVTQTSWTSSLLLTAVLVLSGPVLRSLEFGTWSVILASLVAWSWAELRSTDRAIAGIPLGIAIGMRLFPALLLIPILLARRMRAVVVAATTAVFLNVAGMALFGISMREAVNGLASAENTWLGIGGNGSLVKPLNVWLGVSPSSIVLALALLVSLWVWRASRVPNSLNVTLTIATLGMLLAAPLSWEHYDMLLFLPIALALSRASRVVVPAFAWAWLGLITIGYYLPEALGREDSAASGVRSLSGRLLLVLGVAVCLHQARGVSHAESGALGTP